MSSYLGENTESAYGARPERYFLRHTPTGQWLEIDSEQYEFLLWEATTEFEERSERVLRVARIERQNSIPVGG